MFEAYLRGTFAICSTQPLWLFSRIGSRVNISNNIRPSNPSSALTAVFFETGAMPVPTKLRNPTICGSGDPFHSYLTHS